MRLFYNISITRKLILMQLLTTIVVIVVCSLVFLFTDYYEMKSSKEKSLTMITNVIASNLVAPLLFEDKETALDILNDLRVEKDILNATLLNVFKKPFVQYQKEGISPFSFDRNQIDNETFFYEEDQIFLVHPIKSETERIGTLLIRADVSALSSQLYKRAQLTFLVILFGSLLSFILVMQLQKYITKPINNLEDVMSQIMLHKNYSLRSNVQSGDEIGKMSNVFNELLDDVEHYANKLVETNNQLEQRVEDRTRELQDKNERLIIAKSKEEESNKAKEQFMASISHEIRTPLNAIIGFQELLKDTQLNEEQKEYLNSIDFAGQNLLILINDILDMSKIDAGKFIFNETDLDIRRTVNSVVELMEYRAREKGISLSLEMDDRIPEYVQGDPGRLSQVMMNLVGNAVKFTEKGFVKISVSLRNDTDQKIVCEFKVEDSGIGIPKDKLNHIFDRFTQVSPDTTRKYGGTGLGLTIVKEIIELQGGSIGVKSELGVGSTFYFELTFKKDLIKNHSRRKEIEIKKENIKLNNERLKGLLAEDIALNQQLVNKVMKKWGYDLDIVSNGKEAVEKVKSNDYDFILMDIQMPEMDGNTATSLIRKLNNPTKKDIPIIALTAQASMAEADKCLEAGVNAYMSKPFNMQELRNKILELVHHKITESDSVKEDEKNFSLNYNLDHLIDHAEGDKHFLSEIILEFINEMPRKIKEFDKLYKEKDMPGLNKLFHSLRGILPTFGMYGTLALMDEISKDLKEGKQSDELSAMIHKMISNIQETIEELEKELKSLELTGSLSKH